MPDQNPLFSILSASLEQNPDQPDLRKHLATILLEADHAELAIPHLNRLLTEIPDDGEIGAMLARAYRMMADRFEVSSAPPKLSLVRSIQEDEVEEEEDDVPDLPDLSVPSDIRLGDVKGLFAVKTRLDNSFLKPYRNPELQKAYGVSGSGGLLLYGPPGCGKTFLARAVAGELMARFYAINVVDVASPYHGQSEQRLYDLFELARRNKPSVIFFDEIDALGRKRSLVRETDRSVTTVMLDQMDGMAGNNDGMFFIGATNHPWDVDMALRRPGRLDRTLFVAPPDKEARKAILEANAENRPLSKVDFDYLADRTERFSGADVKHVVTTAAEFALGDAIESNDAKPIEMKHFKKALSEIKPSIRGWLETAKNYALFANDGGQYDDLAAYLKELKLI